jgi:hypothetical protein
MELAALSPTTDPGPALPPDTWAPHTPADKVKLFRSLFRGRADVFPVRFVSKKTGRAGYAPACSNKWLPEICLLKAGGKCSDCSNQAFIPVTDQLIVGHLQGRHVMGPRARAAERSAGRRRKQTRLQRFALRRSGRVRSAL